MALLCLLLVISNHLLLISAPASRGPDNCRCTTHEKRVICRCPYRIRGGSSCSWIGYGGKYSFSVCLDTIPTDFDNATVSIFIKHLRSPVILKGSFPNSPDVWMLQIRESNVSRVQPGAFRGLPLVSNLYLDDNRISSLERHVVCRRRGVYQRRCSLLSTCGFYGDTAWERPAQHWGPACPVSANGYSSAIFHHLQHNQGHSFKLESTDVLDRETRWWERGVKEAIYERMYNPTLNREGGLRVDLSGTWDLALPAPRTDNT
ncbi:hypothetical protein Bbelb_198790 [Branchiostoma belcheri]|nr:hypothetical protein Bbelb_198790 [Branchiostoma belcheri]